VDINVTDGEGSNIFHRLSLVDDETVALEIFDIVALVYPSSSRVIVDVTNNYGDAPIHCCCKYGRIDLVERLIRYGCNCHAINCITGISVVDIARDQNDDELLTFLLQSGCDADSYKTNEATVTADVTDKGLLANLSVYDRIQSSQSKLYSEEKRVSAVTMVATTARASTLFTGRGSSLICNSIDELRGSSSPESESSIRSFASPLRILDHIRDHSFNVQS
jgi:ankyrin repeat protein